MTDFNVLTFQWSRVSRYYPFERNGGDAHEGSAKQFADSCRPVLKSWIAWEHSLRFKYRAASGADDDSQHGRTASQCRCSCSLTTISCNRPRIRLASASCKPTSTTERQRAADQGTQLRRRDAAVLSLPVYCYDGLYFRFLLHSPAKHCVAPTVNRPRGFCRSP
jgi:hypothetical protein